MARGTSPSSAQGKRPLEGVRVLDFTRVLSGPHATRMLADLGAEVIKVEPPMGDLTRFATPRINSQSSYFTQQNVGKKNISLDMTKPEAVEILKLLVARCDVVIENFRPGVMKKMGLDYEALRSSNPRLIYASISGYGATGPWVTRRAYAPVVNAETGITKHQGDVRGGQYANDPHSHGDVYTALEASAAILAALYQREHTQCGQYIDVSMAETMLYVNEHAHNHLWDDDVPEGTIRSFQPADYPVLTVADGSMVVVSGHPAEKGTFDFFVGAMEKPELLSDERFKDIEHRLQHFSELMSIMLEWAKTVPTADEIEERLAKNQLACGRLRSVRELAETDWAESRGAIVNIDNRGTGTLRIPNSPWHFSGSDTSTRGVAQYRGEDNRDVFSNIVGLDNETIATYERENILLSRGPTTR
jgi:crotonobetainyl-CoA:carnitine CoA-transferase CaiB-like acyl-CoA transferase